MRSLEQGKASTQHPYTHTTALRMEGLLGASTSAGKLQQQPVSCIKDTGGHVSYKPLVSPLQSTVKLRRRQAYLLQAALQPGGCARERLLGRLLPDCRSQPAPLVLHARRAALQDACHTQHSCTEPMKSEV